MHLFRDKIILKVETSNNEHHSDKDKDYDPGMEKDISDDHDSKKRGNISDDDPLVRHEKFIE